MHVLDGFYAFYLSESPACNQYPTPPEMLTQTQTFFSTNFFNFLAPEGERIVSGWTWLYFLFITTFTIATGAVYFTLSQRNRQKIDKEHKANVLADADADAEAELPSKTPMVITPEAKKGNSEIQVVEVGADAHMTAGTE